MRFNNNVVISVTLPIITLVLFIFSMNKFTNHVFDNQLVCSENSNCFDNNPGVAVNAYAGTCLYELATIDFHSIAQSDYDNYNNYDNYNDYNDYDDSNNHNNHRNHLTEKQNKDLGDAFMQMTKYYIVESFTNPSLGNCSCLAGIIAVWIAVIIAGGKQQKK